MTNSLRLQHLILAYVLYAILGLVVYAGHPCRDGTDDNINAGDNIIIHVSQLHANN